MRWPFTKKRQTAEDIPKEQFEALFDTIAEKWLLFCRLPFNEDVSLQQRVELFLGPALEGLIRARPDITFLPTEVVMLIFANGLVQAKTHSALEIQDALGIPRANGLTQS